MKEKPTCQVLPAVAEELKALVLLDHGNKTHIGGDSTRTGSLKTNLTDLPNASVILGTKVSEGHPSAVGFRILLRRLHQGGRPMSEAEANYIALSFKYKPQGNNITLRQASKTDEADWKNAMGEVSLKLACPENEFPEALEDLHCLDLIFNTPEEDHFECYHRKELSALSQIDQIDKIVACVLHSNRVRIFFSSDAVLVNYLRIAIAHDCCGTENPPWNTQLHKDLLPAWPTSPQNQMVAGSSDLLNVIRETLREQKLLDGQNTKPQRRPDARLFREFIRKNCPSAKQEPRDCVYPVFLHVIGSRCVELPFGAYLVNQENVHVTISLLHKLLNVPFQTTDVGIVTLYPAQVEIYRQALQMCHKRAPRKGYGNVWVATIEDWAHKETSFAIVDLVRTATSTGNLGWLSQVRRLEAAFSLHRDGLVIVGDINCAVSADGSVTSSKLDKVLGWFRNHGRVVNVGDGTQSGPVESITTADLKRKDTGPPHSPVIPDGMNGKEAHLLKASRSSLSNTQDGQQLPTSSNPKKTPFQSLYHARYQAICALVDSPGHQLKNEKQTSSSSLPPMKHKENTNPRADGKLFERLTEAYKNEDGETFSNVYIQMLLKAGNLRI